MSLPRLLADSPETFNGIASFCLWIILVALAIAFIPPEQKSRRGAVWAIAAGLTARMTLIPLTENYFLNGYVVILVWATLLRAFDLLLLKGAHITPKVNEEIQKLAHDRAFKPSSTFSRLFRAIITLLSPRYLNTSWAISKNPPFSAHDASYVPTRGRFIQQRTLAMVISYLIIDITNVMPPPDISVQFPLDKQVVFSRLSEVTLEELAKRLLGTLVTWLVMYLYIIALANFFALVAVGSGLSQPHSFPPLFGSFKESYTIRHFWGTTWHQTMRAFLDAISEFVATMILSIPKGTLLSRYMRLTFAFALSGLVHVSLDIEEGLHPLESGAPRFFLMQAGGIMFEDAVQEIYRRCGGKANAWTRVIGYIWFLSFISWTTPSWTWVTARAVFSRQDKNLPFSPLTYLGFESLQN